jgi:hypothetical protein
VARTRRSNLALSLALAFATFGLSGRAIAQVPRPSTGPKAMRVGPPGPLQVATQEQALDVGSVADGVLGAGDPVWPERRFVDTWSLRGRAGSTVVVDLLSDQFDAVLYLVSHFQMTWNDDGAGGCDARLEVTFPENGVYTLLASSYHGEEGGRYTLRVSDRPTPPLAGSCQSTGGPVPSEALPPPNESCDVARRMGWLSIAAEVDGGPDFPAILARERTACELGIEVRSGDEWPNGSVARVGGRWDYPNGNTAILGNRWDYPNGNTAHVGNRWDYPDGSTAALGDRWFLPDGTPTTAAGIIEFALARLAPGRAEQLLAYYRDSTGDWQSLVLLVMASEASR